MKNLVRRSLRILVCFLARHAGLGVFELPEFEHSTRPEDLDWLSEELPPDPRFLTTERITIH